MEQEVVNEKMKSKLQAASKGKECIETAKVTKSEMNGIV